MKHHYCTPSFWQGVRRISALLVCMLFTFVFVVSPIKVKAEAFPIPPVWLPMNPYNAQGLHDNYVLLNDEQKEIVKEIIGAVNIVNLGFGQYVLTNPINGVSSTRQFLREYGGTFLETFWTQIMGTSRAMTDFVGSTIYKASTYDTLEEYEADTAPTVSSGSQKYFQISPELTVAFKNWYRANGGVEDWQISVKPFAYSAVWNIGYFSEQQQASYDNSIANAQQPTVRINRGNDYNVRLFSQANGGSNSVSYFFRDYNNLFIDSSTDTIYLVNNSGTKFETNYATVTMLQSGYISNSFQINVGANIRLRDSSAPYNNYITNVSFNLANYDNNYVNVVRAYFNNEFTNANMKIFFQDWIDHVYVGTSWSSKQEIYNIDDLNIGSTPSEYIDNIPDTGYVDINKLIGQIADEVINLRTVVEESVLVKDNDSVIPYADSLLVAIDKYINQPESGVVIPSDLFGGLTGVSGPVSYLWFMTKPLVSYTGDLLGLLTLDGDGTFQFTGLGYIVIGVVTIGIIGGLVTKCLL